MKRILLDQNIPHKLVGRLAPHRVETAFDRGWSSLRNGDLLDAAEAAGFELLITADQSLSHQQNLTNRRLAVIVLDTNRWPFIAPHIALISAAIGRAERGSYQAIACFRHKPG